MAGQAMFSDFAAGLLLDKIYVFITGNVVRRKYVEPHGASCIVLLSPAV